MQERFQCHMLRRRFVALGLAALLACGVSRTTAHAETHPEFKVIVDPQSRYLAVSREFLENAFLKKTTRWEDGELIRPVDLRADAETRKKFSQRVLKRSVAAVRSYWQQRIFSGRGVPPPELDTDEAVVAYVLSHRGAVGYVSGNATVHNAKVLAVR
jgi:hypothetical protein